MKATLFRKDNMGVIVGRLKSPNEIQYEDNGSIKIFQLSGTVVDTEYNDVLVLGKKISDIEFEVHKMESLPHENDNVLGFKANGVDGAIYSLAIPKNKLIDINECQKDSSNYHVMHFKIDEKTSLFLNVFGQIQEEIANDCYVFLLKGPLLKENHEFGVGYAKKEWVTKYGAGYQIMS